MDADGEGMALDAATEARVRTALSISGPMPDEVWRRLQAGLADESAARRAAAAIPSGAAAAAAASPASPAPAAAAAVPLAPRRRRTPLLAGLVAAAAAIVAVAVIAPQLTGGGGELVATEAAPQASAGLMAADAGPPEGALSESALSEGAPRAAAPAAPGNAAKAAPSAAAAEAAPMASVRSRAAAPFAVRQVMRTGTDYTADTIGEAVMALVDTVGAGQTRLMSSVTQEPDPTEGATGFTATVEGLAGCLLALTAASDRQALVIDRATFQGADAGIVVVPVGIAASDPATPFDQIDIWVVTPDCGSTSTTVVWQGTLTMP